MCIFMKNNVISCFLKKLLQMHYLFAFNSLWLQEKAKSFFWVKIRDKGPYSIKGE